MKKILISSILAAAMAFGMLGCVMNEDAHDIISVKGDTASIDYTNTSDEVYRGFRTLRTKHTDAVAVVTIDTNKTNSNLNPDNGKSGGVFGFVFDLQKGKDTPTDATKEVEVYDFTAVAVRWNNTTSKLETYVSRFEKIDPTKMDGGSNFRDVNGIMIGQTKDKDGNSVTCKASEIEYLKGSNTTKSTSFAEINGLTPDSNGIIKVAIEVVAELNNENKPTGKYSVKYYREENVSENPKEEAKENGTEKVKTGQIKPNSTPLTVTGSVSTVTVPASWSATNLNRPVQTEMGFYASVYSKSSLTGSIQLPYILHEDEVIEWDD